MRENYQLIEIPHDQITVTMQNRRNEGCRLVQMHAVALEGASEVFYSVSTTENEFINYKTVVPHGVTIPSISDIFPSSVLYENEMKELFGVDIDCISLDYNNRLYRIKEKTPFKIEVKEAKD